MKLQRYRVSATRYEITRKPYCDDPVPIHRSDNKPAEGYVGISLDMHGPCRKCPKCLAFRQYQWAERIEREIAKAPRSWFVVLTFDPIHLAGVVSESYRDTKREGGSIDAIERAAYKHVQLYLKRLRKSGGRFRLFGVAEYGDKEGRLHFHMLLHEVSEGSLTKRELQGQWRSFVYAKLVSTGSSQKTARYVSKYLTKSISVPRASLQYGKKPE